MKRFTSLLLAVLMLLSLAACGVKTAPPAPDSSPQGESASGLEGKTDTAEEMEITFTEQVVADNEECKITITGFERDDEWEAFYIYTLLENKSSDKTYRFLLNLVAVNGVSIDPRFYTSGDNGEGEIVPVLAPGEKCTGKIYVEDFDLCCNDIGGYTDIELVFQVQDDSSHENVLERKAVHTYPYGEDKAAEFVREAQPSDKVVLDNEYATVIFVGEGNEKLKDMWNKYYVFEMFVINKTDKPLLIYGNSFSVNGQEEDATSNIEVDGGKCSFGTIIFLSKEDLEKNGIKDYEDFEEIKFKSEIYGFRIDDYGFLASTWSDDTLLGEYEITLYP